MQITIHSLGDSKMVTALPRYPREHHLKHLA